MANDMNDELESCPLCGALPADQVNSRAVRELVTNPDKFSGQVILNDCASRISGMDRAVEMARQIVAWDDNGRLADDEWLVERNDAAIIAICRAFLSAHMERDNAE